MKKQNFADFVQNLAVHFGSTRPSQERMKSWYERVMDLPDEFMAWCVDRIKDNFDAFPRNLSKAILALWIEWQKEHPNRIAKFQEHQGCDKCNRGWLIARLGNETATFRCGHCQCVQQDIAVIATREELEGYGWYLESMAGGSGSYYRELAREKFKALRRDKNGPQRH